MPRSVYRCAQCGQRNRFPGDPPPPCRDCGGTLCEKCCDAALASAVAVAARREGQVP